MVTGWIAITLAILGAYLNWTPGLGSLIGLLFSFAALFIAVFSVRKAGNVFFGVTLAITMVSVLALNHTFGLGSQSSVSAYAQGIFYIVLFLIVVICLYFAGENHEEYKKDTAKGGRRPR